MSHMCEFVFSDYSASHVVSHEILPHLQLRGPNVFQHVIRDARPKGWDITIPTAYLCSGPDVRFEASHSFKEFFFEKLI
jgi:peptidase E